MPVRRRELLKASVVTGGAAVVAPLLAAAAPAPAPSTMSATSGAPIDVRHYASTLPAGATWANVAAYSVSSYVTAAPAQYKFNVQPAGGGTVLFNDRVALPGQPIGTVTAGCTVGIDCEATPGTLVPGSAVTLIVFPRSVAGSKAANFTTPGGSFMWDKRPPRTCTVSFGC